MTEYKALRVSVQLLEVLYETRIPFAHWKGNSHIMESLAGKTDIELLLQPAQREVFETAMRQSGFKRVLGAGHHSADLIHDWLGFDQETGSILHLHTHYGIPAGEINGKTVFLPWMEVFFRHLIKDESSGWPMPRPELEMFVLLMRTCLKVKMNGDSNWIISRVGELLGLVNRCDLAFAKILAAELGMAVPGNFETVLSNFSRTHEIDEVVELAEQLFLQLSIAGSFNNSFSSRLEYSIEKTLNKLIRKYFWLLGPRVFKKTIPGGGKVIAVIGSDGSGKSTLTNELINWLGGKMDTHYFYLGKSPFIRSYNKKIYSPYNQLTGDGKLARYARKLLGPAYYVLLVGRKLAMIRLAHRLARGGSMVICDRFPQKNILGYNDGPRLQGNQNGAMAEKEMKYFDTIEATGADLLFRLNVSPEVAAARKPEHNADMIRKKSENIHRVNIPGTRLIDIDANQPYEQVLLEVKKKIWEII